MYNPITIQFIFLGTMDCPSLFSGHITLQCYNISQLNPECHTECSPVKSDMCLPYLDILSSQYKDILSSQYKDILSSQ